MIVPKLSLLNHLERIHCHGEVGEAVLTGQFACTAATPDKQLMVHTVGLSETEPLPNEVGVVDLPLLINAVKSLGEGEGKVSVAFENDRIVVEERGRAKINMVTASPDTIGTKVLPENGQRVLAKLTDGKRALLSQSVVNDLLKLQAMLKAENLTAHVDKMQIAWTVGQETGHFAEVLMQVPGATSRATSKHLTDEPYELVFNARALVAVLKQVTDFTQTAFVVTGPNALVAVSDPAYTYLLSPVRRG